MWGLIQCTRDTTPVRVMGLFMSNWPASEWCALAPQAVRIMTRPKIRRGPDELPMAQVLVCGFGILPQGPTHGSGLARASRGLTAECSHPRRRRHASIHTAVAPAGL